MGKSKVAEFDNVALYKHDNGEMYTVSYNRNGKVRNLLLFKPEAERFRDAIGKKDKALIEDALYRVQ